MKRTVTALDARRRFGELLESVYLRGDEVIIERAGKPMAVVIRPSGTRFWNTAEEDEPASPL